MDEPGIDRGHDFLARPHAFGERHHRTNRWLPFAPLAGLIGIMVATLIYPPLDRASFVMPLLLLFIACTFLLAQVQKKQRRGDDVSAFFPVTTWLAWAPVCVALIVLANGALDRNPVDSHPEVITQKLVRRGKSNSYYFQTPSWRPNHSFEELQVPYRVFTQFQTNDRIIVEVHRGAFGIPWLGAIQKTHN